MNNGKRLEQNIKSSCNLQNIFCYRLNDNAGAFSQDNLRFTTSNMCDFLIFNDGKLLALEVKSTRGKSLPYANIRENQLEKMKQANFYGVNAGFLIDFSDFDSCFYIDIVEFLVYQRKNDRKSLPLDYLEENCLRVETKKKKVNKFYDMLDLFRRLED